VFLPDLIGVTWALSAIIFGGRGNGRRLTLSDGLRGEEEGAAVALVGQNVLGSSHGVGGEDWAKERPSVGLATTLSGGKATGNGEA
jgi:hypothetical protein